jgi:hypothetical protein
MTNNKQQTAVEFLIEQLSKTRDWQRVINEVNQSSTAVRDVIMEAKAMEKDQHEKTWAKSRIEKEIHEWYMCEKTFNEYYNETYINNQ